MIRLTLLAVTAALLVLTLADARKARADLAQANAKIEGLAEAARFWRAEQARRDAAARLDQELQQGAGADAALSDYLRSGAGRVWP